MTPEIKELITASKDAVLQIAENCRIVKVKPTHNPCLVRLMAAIKAVEGK